MVKVNVNAPDSEPEQRKFELPSEAEHLFQIVDATEDKQNSSIITVKLEVAEGEELGRSILHRVNLDSEWKGFFLTRLFLKAIGEQYKGAIEINSDMWIGKCFYASIIHNTGKNGKTYANIDEFNFEKVVEQQPTQQKDAEQTEAEKAWDE